MIGRLGSAWLVLNRREQLTPATASRLTVAGLECHLPKMRAVANGDRFEQEIFIFQRIRR
jgi:hypothetical protein